MLRNTMIRCCSLLALTAAWIGCSSTKAGGEIDGRYETPKGPSSGPLDAGPPPPLVRDGGADDTRALFQTKSAAQLAASITQCVGADKTMIAADMLTAGPGGAPPCSVASEPNACFF